MKTRICPLLLAALLLGATTPSTSGGEIEMERLFKSDFAGFQPPDATKVKVGAVRRAVSNTSYDDVWEALLVVAMQRQVIVSASKGTGVLVAMQVPVGSGYLLSGFPTVIAVERKGQSDVEIYCNWSEDYYSTTGKKPVPKVKVRGMTKERLAAGYLDKVVNQALSKNRWDYLRRQRRRMCSSGTRSRRA